METFSFKKLLTNKDKVQEIKGIIRLFTGDISAKLSSSIKSFISVITRCSAKKLLWQIFHRRHAQLKKFECILAFYLRIRVVFFPLCLLRDLRNFHPFLYLGACCSQKKHLHTHYFWGCSELKSKRQVFICLFALLYCIDRWED